MYRRPATVVLALVALTSLLMSGLLLAAQNGRIARSQADTSDIRAQVRRLERLVSGLRAESFDPEGLAQRVAPSVVTLFTRVGLGTGFVIRADTAHAWIATNFHVVSTSRGLALGEITAEQNGVKWPAVLESWSMADDLAIVRIDSRLPPLELGYGGSDVPQVGDPVLAYGSPEGLQGTVTVGIISAIRHGWLQTDAEVNHGNSGGPLVDASGKVLGITSLGVVGGGSGLAFAVDARKLCSLLDGIRGC